MLKFAAIAALVALPLVGCGSDQPVAIGPDTYMTTNTGTWSWSSSAELQEGLYREANAYCTQQGRQMMPLQEGGNNADLSQWAHADLKFRCLKPGDPQLARPAFQPPPTQVIGIQKMD